MICSRIRLLALILIACAPWSCTRSKGVAVEVTRPTPAQFAVPARLVVPGRVEAIQQARLDFKLQGRVASVDVRAGARVTAGTVLAQLDNVLQESALAQAQRRYSEAQSLYDDGSLSASVLQSAQRVLAKAQSLYEGTLIRAPFDGLVAEINLTAGERVVPGAGDEAPILMVDLAPRRIRAIVPEANLPLLTNEMHVTVRVPALGARTLTAELERRVPVVNTSGEGNGGVPVIFRFTQYDDLIPIGATAQVEIPSAEPRKGWSVPAQAVVMEGASPFVYRVENGVLKKQSVQVAGQQGSRYQISSGLNGEESLALNEPGLSLREGLKVRVEPPPNTRTEAAGRRSLAR